MEAVVKDGQTLADIAVQECGSLEALADIAVMNGLALTDVPAAGTVIRLPDREYDRVMREYCAANGVSPATARDMSGVRLGIFSEEFTKVFK